MVGLVGSGGVTDSPVDTVHKRQVAECEAGGPGQSVRSSLVQRQAPDKCTIQPYVQAVDAQVYGAMTSASCAMCITISNRCFAGLMSIPTRAGQTRSDVTRALSSEHASSGRRIDERI